MAVKRQQVKSCCGSSSFIFETEKPIKKSQIAVFTQAGYFVPQNFLDAGIFYVQLGNMIATGSFGSNRINVRCNGPKCAEHFDSLSKILEKAVNS